MELRWYRSRPLPTMYLHRRRAQVSREQMAESRGRTTFLGNHLARGKAVLGIHNITVYDNGTYPCLFRDGEPHSETTLALQVAGLGLEPRIHVTEDLDKGIRAECTSAGWYPEPHVEWRDFRGHAVPAVTRFSASATTGLLAVLSRVAVPDRSMGGLTCSISSPLLHERKVAESHLPANWSRKHVDVPAHSCSPQQERCECHSCQHQRPPESTVQLRVGPHGSGQICLPESTSTAAALRAPRVPPGPSPLIARGLYSSQSESPVDGVLHSPLLGLHLHFLHVRPRLPALPFALSPPLVSHTLHLPMHSWLCPGLTFPRPSSLASQAPRPPRGPTFLSRLVHKCLSPDDLVPSALP
ncbi:putative butyrophilin-like protein 10 isoform X2 [Oryctolagus cuniculus]|uniref:putative butyrophilin-like protein 10 isoform X2 n=1 Tax=Oryctolagus cuniculus TaxID=9986 RepID=UPI00387952FF